MPVVRRNDAIAAAVPQGKAGFVVDIEDKDEIVEKLAFLLDPAVHLTPMRQAAREIVREKYSFENYLSRLTAVYEEAIESR